MTNVMIVFVCGGLGCMVRYALALVIPKSAATFPWPTFAANITACLLIALGAYLFREKLTPVAALVITAFCGGLSTFSTFSLETVELINKGHLAMATLYVLSSLIACFLVVIMVSKMV